MLDLELLRSFVSVVEAGGFTRAGERVHRTQSTVSQQIRRLEEMLGHPLLHRNGKPVSLTEVLWDFARARPGLRLDVRCGLSVNLRKALERGELDLAMFKRDAGDGPAI